MTLPTNATRDAARAAQHRQPAIIAEVDLDKCNNTYGVSPCTAGRVNSGTLQSGAASTVRLAAGASSVDDTYNKMTVRITGGTGSGQESKVTDYTGATRDAAVAPAYSPAPDGTSTYDVIDRPNACYNTFPTCQDKPNFVKGTKTIKFCSRGMPIPAGEATRPYVKDADGAVTVIDPEAGMARRATLSLAMADEPDSDVELDPYLLDRPQAAQGTFWARLLRRNTNYAGRRVRVRRGYVVSPWSWLTFLDELYAIDAINGPSRGEVTVVLKDPLKVTDRAKVPVPTDGKIAVELKAVAVSGAARGATATTLLLPVAASAEDDAYNGMELVVTENQGAGQRRAITDYVGATREVTVADFDVVPNTTSLVEVGALEIVLPSGKGAQYTDPATSSKREFIRIGDEIIEYTAKSGDALTFPSTTYRAQFGTARKDHKTGDAVQLCRAFIDAKYTDVVKTLLLESGLAAGEIDTAGFTAAEDDYFGSQFRITVCLSEPEAPADLIAELLPQGNAVLWWSPILQKAKLATLLPKLAAPPKWKDEDTFVEDSVAIEALEALRITSAAVSFGLISATANRREAKNFILTELAIDAGAESANEYADKRPLVVYSRWFGQPNEVALRGWAVRQVNQLRDAPRRVKARLDPKDYTLEAGDQVDIETRGLVDERGIPVTTRALVTKSDDRGGEIDVELRTTTLAKRYGFIAPNGTADYPTDKTYAHVCQNTGLMGDGTSGYLIT